MSTLGRDLGREQGGGGRSVSTLGQDLARHRLEHRQQRLEHVLRALHDRYAFGARPAPLRQAITGFQDELRQVRAELAARHVRG